MNVATRAVTTYPKDRPLGQYVLCVGMELEDSEQEVRNSPLPEGLVEDGAVLVRGPALSGKYALLLGLLSTADEALLVSTSRPADRARTDFENYGDSDSLAVVDCVTRVHGEDGEEGDLLRYAASPKNLTEVGVKFTDLVATLQKREADQVVVGVHSLSELLMYSNVEHVFQFVRIMRAECRDLDWPLVAVVDDTAVDDQTVATLSQPFDTVVTTRVTEDQRREFAVTEGGDGEPAWTTF